MVLDSYEFIDRPEELHFITLLSILQYFRLYDNMLMLLKNRKFLKLILQAMHSFFESRPGSISQGIENFSGPLKKSATEQ